MRGVRSIREHDWLRSFEARAGQDPSLNFSCGGSVTPEEGRTNGGGVRLHGAMGLVAAGGCVVAGIVMLIPWVFFFHMTSIFFLVVFSLGVLTATHGRGTGRLFSALGDWLMGADTGESPPKEHLQIAAKALDFGEFAMLAGGVGVLIGHVQMLANMADPGGIGPALAVSLLALLYGVLLHTFIAVPLSQHHLQLAGAEAEGFQHQGPGLRLFGVIGLSIGMSFFVMLVAMSDF